MSPRQAFTLIELLLATTLSAILLGGVLVVASALTRDARRLEQHATTPRMSAAMDLLKWDLTNARSMTIRNDGRWIMLVGHAGIAPGAKTSNNRLTKVSYRVQRLDRQASVLIREQVFLDNLADPQPLRELVATGVASIGIAPITGDAQPEREIPANGGSVGNWLQLSVPTRARISIEASNSADSLSQEVWTR
jgi:prepilin-type N-terminal cleavage/methylation domain-containing protein